MQPWKIVLWKDKHFMIGKKQQQQAARKMFPSCSRKITGKSMMQRIINSKISSHSSLAAATRMTLYLWVPFPETQIPSCSSWPAVAVCFRGPEVLLHIIPVLDPYIGYSVALSGLYILPSRRGNESELDDCPSFQTPGTETNFPGRREFTIPAKNPRRKPSVARIRERLVHPGCHPSAQSGVGKRVAACIVRGADPWPTRSGDPESRVGGLVLEVKGDFVTGKWKSSHATAGPKITSKPASILGIATTPSTTTSTPTLWLQHRLADE